MSPHWSCYVINCKDCTHWKPEGSQDVIHWGICNQPKLNDNPDNTLALVYIRSHPLAPLVTRMDFGCVMGEKK